MVSLNFVAELIISVLEMLKWSDLYKVEVEGTYVVIGGGITLREGEITVTRPETIIQPEKTFKTQGWIVETAIETPGSRWEPGDVDIVEAFTSESILSCVDFIIGLCFKDLKDGNFPLYEHAIEVEEERVS